MGRGDGCTTARATDLDPVRLLANRSTRELLALLVANPSYPRALARRLGLSEGDVQRKLHRLERAGLVTGAWKHDGKTVKEYEAAVARLTLDLSDAANPFRFL